MIWSEKPDHRFAGGSIPYPKFEEVGWYDWVFQNGNVNEWHSLSRTFYFSPNTCFIAIGTYPRVFPRIFCFSLPFSPPVKSTSKTYWLYSASDVSPGPLQRKYNERMSAAVRLGISVSNGELRTTLLATSKRWNQLVKWGQWEFLLLNVIKRSNKFREQSIAEVKTPLKIEISISPKLNLFPFTFHQKSGRLNNSYFIYFRRRVHR